VFVRKSILVVGGILAFAFASASSAQQTPSPPSPIESNGIVKILQASQLTVKLNSTNNTRPVIVANGTTIELANETWAEILAKMVTGEHGKNGSGLNTHLKGDLLLIVFKGSDKREVLLQVRATEMTITWVPFSPLSATVTPK
jgi:hypothetical protein